MPDVPVRAPPDFRLVVAGVPKGVGRVRSRVVTAKDGRQFVAHHTPSATRIEQDVIRYAAQQAMAGRAPFDCALELKYLAYLPVPASWGKLKTAEAIAGHILPTGKPDGDNIVKFVDALKQIVFRDDSRITDWHIWKRYSERPRVVVEIRKLAELI